MSEKTAFPGLTHVGRSQVKAAVALYAKHLRKLGEEARDLGKGKDADSYEAEAKGIEDDLQPELDKDNPALTGKQRAAVEHGLKFFLKNLRAAKGTVRALGKGPLADQFEEEAVEVEQRLVPFFAEQASLV